MNRIKIQTAMRGQSRSASRLSRDHFLSLALGKATVLSVAFLAGLLGAQQPGNPEPATLKAQAYELYDARRFADAAAQFQSYLALNPNDARALFDYASLLSQLNRHADAARQFELLHQRHSNHETGYFRLGVEYVALGRVSDARKVFSELEKSSNRDMAGAARDALKKLEDDAAAQTQFQTHTAVFALARDAKHAEVIAAVDELERQGDRSFLMQMQRLYSMSALGQYAPALERADRLGVNHPHASDLALLRADLLAQLERRAEAEVIWRRLVRENAGTPVGTLAAQRLNEPSEPPEEDAIYTLVRQQRHREAAAAIDAREQAGKLSRTMALQRVYSLQQSGDHQRAADMAARLVALHPEFTEAAMIQADLLVRLKRRDEATHVLKRLKEENPDSPAAREAVARLQALPVVANIDKWYWGEAYASGDYLGRYGTVVGSGFIRHGTFIPKARWLQPYAEFRFGVDTRSGGGARETRVQDHQVGFYGGMRAQLFESEYLFLYGQGGVNEDLLDQRDRKDWALDYQAGIYGFKSWGPGPVFHTSRGEKAGAVSTKTVASTEFFWRGDWFVDVGGDFSYYHRYTSWIGYGQMHEGFRVFQIGPKFAGDAYLVENVTWDVRGNYFDNSLDFGPGARLIWLPHSNWQVVLRTEWLYGFYLGRDELNNRGNASRTFDGVQVGLSVGATW